jgi:hypothetical protein
MQELGEVAACLPLPGWSMLKRRVLRAAVMMQWVMMLCSSAALSSKVTFRLVEHQSTVLVQIIFEVP